MKLARLFGTAAVLGLASACAPGELSVLVLNAHPLNGECTIQTRDFYVPEGYLDIGLLGANSNYVAIFGVQSEMQASSTVVGDDIVAPGSRNDFLIDRVEFTYDIPGVTNPQIHPYYAVIAAGARGNSGSVGGFMLTPEAATALNGAVAPNGVREVLVTFQYQGRLRSAPEIQRSSTNRVTFPIRVVNFSPPTCTDPLKPVLSVDGPCGNTQDSFQYFCVGT
jgi:hypothetical protein